MNFQRIPPPDTPQDLLDLAFRRARSKATTKKIRTTWLETIKRKESIKLDVARDNLTRRLQKVLESYPAIESLPIFYQKLMELTLDTTQYKTCRRKTLWALKTMHSIHKTAVRSVAKASTKEEIKQASNHCYGRVSSIIKQLKSTLANLTKIRKILKTYPDIKDLPTICIYGFPNVGKSTLLNSLALTKAKVASYAFTTKTINSGTLIINDTKIQILDVPGTLARDKYNNVELQAELVLHDLAHLTIYVFDLTETCGYTIQDQVTLYKMIKNIHPTLIYLSKKDIAPAELLEQFPLSHLSVESLKQKIEEYSKTLDLNTTEV